MRVLVSIAKTAEYLYGMRLRPFSIGTQPKGHTRFIDIENVPADIKRQFREPQYRFGILVYPFPLSGRDVEHYSLTDLNISDEYRWGKFVEFAKQIRDYAMTYEDFELDYIHPKGELRTENPLHEMSMSEFFNLLAKNGYSGRLDGLKKMYNSL